MPKELDRLGKLFEMQKTLQENAYGYSFDTLTLKERVVFIKEMSIHATQEIHEMMYELPYFKPWKDYDGMTEAEHNVAMNKAREEYIDVVHFMLNMGIGLGITPEGVFNGYAEKNQENYDRQVEGYTHDKSYRP